VIRMQLGDQNFLTGSRAAARDDRESTYREDVADYISLQTMRKLK